MSDEKDQGKGNLRVLEFSNTKEKRNSEANKVVSDMFKQLSERAAAGDIEDFVITFKSESRGVESMIGAGGGVGRFDFIGYIATWRDIEYHKRIPGNSLPRCLRKIYRRHGAGLLLRSRGGFE